MAETSRYHLRRLTTPSLSQRVFPPKQLAPSILKVLDHSPTHHMPRFVTTMAHRCLNALLSVAPWLLLGAGVMLAPFSATLRRYLAGQWGLQKRLANTMQSRKPKIKLLWMHAASVGEALQGWPLLEHFLAQGHQGILTYTSPSVALWLEHHARFKHPNLLGCHYCPYDLPWQVGKAVATINPQLMLYVKWDIWPNLARILQRHGAKQVLVGGVLHAKSKRLKTGWLSWLARSIGHNTYRRLTAVYAASQQDATYLKQLVPANIPVQALGDLRYHSTMARLATHPRLNLPASFHQPKHPVLVAGSVWPTDATHLLPAVTQLLHAHPTLQLIWVPHQIEAAQLTRVEEHLSPFGCIRLSTWQAKAPQHPPAQLPLETMRVLLVDSVGQLAALYADATLAYIGGAFGVGVHNVLEGVVAGAPCLFGPNIGMDNQARALVEANLAAVVKNEKEIYQRINHLLTDRQALQQQRDAMQQWVQQQRTVLPNYVKHITHWLNH